jgi:CBS domain containing-hemolysin-like protein
LLLYRLGRIPQAGEEITVDDVRLIVEDASDRSVTAVRVIQPPSAEA